MAYRLRLRDQSPRTYVENRNVNANAPVNETVAIAGNNDTGMGG